MAHSIEYIYMLIDKYSDKLDAMGRATNKFQEQHENAFGKVMKKMNLFGINVASILSAEGLIEVGKKIWEFSKEAVAAYDKVQETEIILNNTLKNSKVGKTFDEMDSSAKILMENSFFSRKDILSGVSTSLLKFRTIRGQTFDRVQQDVMDMAAWSDGLKANEGSLNKFSNILGRALETGQVRQLKGFTIEEQKIIAAMFKSGQVLQARELILKRVEKAYGGTAQKLAESDAGLAVRTRVLKEELMEGLGKVLSPARSELLKLQVRGLQQMTMALEKISFWLNNSPEWQLIKPELAELVENILNIINDTIGQISDSIGANNEDLSVLLGLLVGASHTINKILSLVHKWYPVFKVIQNIMTAILMPTTFLTQIVGKLVMKFAGWAIHVRSVKELWDGIKNKIEEVWKIIQQIIKHPLKSAWDIATGKGIDIGGNSDKTTVPKPKMQNTMIHSALDVIVKDATRVGVKLGFVKKDNLGYQTP
jgi:hypothetical protein